MTSHSSRSHRSSGVGRQLSSPDPPLTLPIRRWASRSVMIRRSWVRAIGATTDRRDDVASDFVTARAAAVHHRRAA